MASSRFKRRAQFYAAQRTFRSRWRELTENMRLAMKYNGWS